MVILDKVRVLSEYCRRRAGQYEAPGAGLEETRTVLRNLLVWANCGLIATIVDRSSVPPLRVWHPGRTKLRGLVQVPYSSSVRKGLSSRLHENGGRDDLRL